MVGFWLRNRYIKNSTVLGYCWGRCINTEERTIIMLVRKFVRAEQAREFDYIGNVQPQKISQVIISKKNE